MKDAFEKLNRIAPAEITSQKIVPVKRKKRDSEKGYMLWLDKELLKKIKQRALDEEENVKNIIEKALKMYLK